MLLHPMLERLRGLGLSAMAEAFNELQNNAAGADLSREDWLGLLIDREVSSRKNKPLDHRLDNAAQAGRGQHDRGALCPPDRRAAKSAPQPMHARPPHHTARSRRA